jgi:PEP-CTERM motif
MFRRLSIVAVAVLLASPVWADITVVPPVTNNKYDYRFVATWDFDVGADEAANPAITGDWGVFLFSDTSVDGVEKDLFVDVNHNIPPHGEGVNLIPRITLGPLSRPDMGTSRVAKARQEDHGDHYDIVRVLAQVPAGNAQASITTTGTHSIKPLGSWSALGLSGKIKVKAKTADDEEYTPEKGGEQMVVPSDHPSGRLRPDTNEYTVYAAVGGAVLPEDPLVVTSLSFIGEIGDDTAQLDFGAAAEAFGYHAPNAFLAPVLADGESFMDTYVGIDLTQWLSFMPSGFDEGELGNHYTFVDGYSDDLPGIYVSSTPVSFNSTTGMYESASPVSGDLTVAGFIDGKAVPEPTSLVLSLIGLAALWLHRRATSST